MKRLLFISVTLLITATGGAQSQFGFFIGPQATSSHYTVTGKKQPTDYKYGLQLGMGWKIPFENKLYFAPEIFYSLKGYTVKFSQYAYPPDATATDNNTMIHCGELAALLQIDLGNQPGHCFIKFGPSLDFQLFGKEKFHLLSGSLINRQMKYGYAEYGHYGANAIVQFGYESSSGFSIYAQYSFGLSNLSNVDDGPNIRHRVAGISFGKYLSHKKIVMNTRNKE